MRSKILVIEDDPETGKLLKEILTKNLFSCFISGTGEDGLAFLKSQNPDLVLLDLSLPDMNGLEICRLVKNDLKINIPVIILSAKSSEEEKVSGLTAGADDYILKPFSQMELIARVKAALRRYGRYDESEVLRFDNLEINVPENTVSVNDREIKLTSREYDLLLYLVKKSPRALTKQNLFETVWGQDFLATRTLDVHINRLRRKLGPKISGRIKTIHKVGYKFLK